MLQPILTIDLATRETNTFSVPPEWERDYLGGASLAARLLYSTLTPDLEPFSPESPLLFLNGPLSGTLGPTVGRFVVCGRSPATGLWAESNCGGFWGPELRFAGWDGVWVTGRAEKPVYLWIHGDQVEVCDAAEIWGQDTYETQETIKRQVSAPGARVACIGPAGENGVLFSGIFFPVASLPPWAQKAAWALPLTHSVDLNRALFAGAPGAGAAADLAWLALFALAARLVWLRSIGRYTSASS